MSPQEFRRAGYQLIDWIAGYWERIEEYPVLSRVEPGGVRAELPPHPPEKGEAFSQILADVERVVMPGITHWQSPGFFGYFPGNASGPAVLGDLLSSGLGVQGMLWSTSPAATEVETHVLDWLVEMLGLPRSFSSTGAGGGVIQDSASSSTLVALLAARERATGGEANRRGTGQDLVAYASDQGHSSIEKGARVAGFGEQNVRSVPTDTQQRMILEALESAVAEDLAAGKTPAVVTATVGTTSTGAVDPLGPIGEICRRHGLWFHVDAAYAGTAAVLPEMRWIHDGLDLADSYVFDPHKWMLTNFDCSALYVADRSAVIGALSVLPEYLRNEASASGRVIDYRDWHIPLGRRFRALKLWFVIRHYGVEGIGEHVRTSMELASRFASLVEGEPSFEVVAPVHFGLVCFRHRSGDEVNQSILDSVNRAGDFFLTHTRLDGSLVLRLATGSPQTRLHHIEAVWEQIRAAAGGRG